ncbi:unnamed protein product [Ceratitis capitata]|uniref:(Mediterranean fruit fly) hypothetical protein n=1 Tax=Ceratitis capitata TaxID=7213 RepID=A0A811VH62_CERCA|nr:unnamed protein product [Ceratitis capitata]
MFIFPCNYSRLTFIRLHKIQSFLALNSHKAIVLQLLFLFKWKELKKDRKMHNELQFNDGKVRVSGEININWPRLDYAMSKEYTHTHTHTNTHKGHSREDATVAKVLQRGSCKCNKKKHEMHLKMVAPLSALTLWILVLVRVCVCTLVPQICSTN